MEYRFRLLLACLISPLMIAPIAHPFVAYSSVIQTRGEVMHISTNQSPQPASAPTSPPPPTSPALPDWMWWLILSIIPLAVLGAILYGFQRTNQPNLQPNQQRKRTTHRRTKSAKHRGRSAHRSRLFRGKPISGANESNAHQNRAEDRAVHDTPNNLNDSNNPNNVLAQNEPFIEQLPEKPLEKPLEQTLEQSRQSTENLNQRSVYEQSTQQQSTQQQSTHQQPIHELGELTVSETTRLSRVDIVEELIRDLHSADASRRRKAIWELGQRGDSRAVQPLVDLLMDSDSQQRSLILAAVSEIGIRTLKPMNRALLMSVQDDSAEVRKNAIRDVTRVFDLVTQMSQLLQYATSDDDREVQETAEWALEQLNRIRPLPGTEGLPRLGDRDLPSVDGSADPRLPFPPELD